MSLIFIIYAVLMLVAILILYSKDASLSLKGFSGIAIVGLTLALIIFMLLKFSVKVGYIHF